MKTFFLTLVLFSAAMLQAQKKVIDHTAYNDWKRIGDIQLSNDGKYTAYTIRPHRGDGYLYIVNNETGKKDSIFKGVNPRFTSDSKVLLFKITPGFDTLRNSELNKVKKDKWPKDTLGIWYAVSDSLIRVPKVKEFSVAEEGGRYAYLSYENTLPSDKSEKPVREKKKSKKEKKKKEKEEEAEVKSDGNLLVVSSSNMKERHEIKNVTAYKFSENGRRMAFVMHRKLKSDSSIISMMDFGLKESAENRLWDSYTSVSAFDFDKTGNKLVYLVSQDTAKESRIYQMHLYDFPSGQKTQLIKALEGDWAQHKSISQHFSPYFSSDGSKIFFGIAGKPDPVVKDSLLESEKARLDLWHWKDDRLQPQQLVELSRDEKESLFGVYHLNSSSFLIVENDSIQLRHNPENPGAYVLGYNETPYESHYNWEYPNKRDVYRVNIFTGELKLLRKANSYSSQLSPSGKYYTYFDEKDLQQYLMDIDNGQVNCLTCIVKTEWLEDVNGMPVTPGPAGGIDWLRGEKELLISSRYNIYKYNIELKEIRPLINVNGDTDKTHYSLHLWNSDSLYLDMENAYLTAFFEKDKSEAFYKVKWNYNSMGMVELAHTPHAYSGFKKASNSNRIVFQRNSLQDYPDLYTMQFKEESEIKRLSLVNPQQKEYNWATVDLIRWKSYSGIPLEGLLYKPENYNPSKKYPLLVYFYEMYSDELHNHYAPKPTASIIYPTEYASAGYLVLIPNIRYQAGHPARSAYDCIMSGTDYVIKHYPVDSTRMGLQGQSWGGYQTAQLITMTSRYKAAMAGAPVGNMFSAYGGIRWGSGLNRQFQYERTQSRIGKTIWEAPDLYVENSPVFHLPKVKTPLLIMHNDADGAVPWYQGIELFTGLKRLGKPVWLLNYNGDDHNLMKNANRIDLSIRMRQFFDHYLLGAPAPVWLEDGLPALEKGKYYGLDLKMK